MGSRRASREGALQALYRADIMKDNDEEAPPSRHLSGLEAYESADDEGKAFIVRLVELVERRRDEIDQKMAAALAGWTPDRLGYMERAILRLAIGELLFDTMTPGKVVINEAVELAKRYCDAGSAALINGALDKIYGERGG